MNWVVSNVFLACCLTVLLFIADGPPDEPPGATIGEPSCT